MEEFEIVVPGRLCILGEHSDWAATYASQNSEVPEGFAVVCSTNEALYCNCQKVVTENSEKYLEFQRIGDFVDKLPPNSCKIALDFDILKDFASKGNFFAYVAGSAAALLGHLRKKGAEDLIDGNILIQNYKSTLPLKKGLSSSAAICVSVVKCFNSVFNLNLTLEETMDIAYQGENRFTSSQCGRMDQCVAMGPNASAVMKFKGDSCEMTVLKCGRQLHFVFADLKSSKDTIVILRELNACFPFPQNESQVIYI